MIAAIDTPLKLLSELKALEKALLISLAASFPPSWKTLRSEPAEKNFSPCVIGLVTEAERLYDLRKNRLNSLKEDQNSEYVNIDKIRDELDSSKKLFKENNWPTIDVTRKSVEETAASVIKIYEIKNKKNA